MSKEVKKTVEPLKIGAGIATAKKISYKNGGANGRVFVVKVAEKGGAWEDIAPRLITLANKAALEALEAEEARKSAKKGAAYEAASLRAKSLKEVASARQFAAAYFGAGFSTEEEAIVRAAEYTKLPNTRLCDSCAKSLDWATKAVEELEAKRKAAKEAAKAERERRAALTPAERIAEATAKAEAAEAKRAEAEARRNGLTANKAEAEARRAMRDALKAGDYSRVAAIAKRSAEEFGGGFLVK